MKLLDRYIARHVVFGITIVMLVLLSLFVFVSFVVELGDTGRGHYGVLQAAEYVILTIPRLVYQLFPLAALLGSMVGLGLLANNSELIVMRASGVSQLRVVYAVLKIGIVLMILAGVFGELVAPASEEYAQNLRATAMDERITHKTRQGYWLRDGQSYVNIQDIFPDGSLSKLSIYQLDDDFRMTAATHARKAIYQGNETWELRGIQLSRIDESGVATEAMPVLKWKSLVDTNMLDLVAVKPDFMAAWSLYEYINYLDEQGLAVEVYELAFWRKVFAPFTTMVMMFLAIPFVFGSTRSVAIGQRILLGVLIGVGFHLLNQSSTYLAQVYQWNSMVSASVPTLFFFSAAFFLYRRAG